jgi:hypothetical protein
VKKEWRSWKSEIANGGKRHWFEYQLYYLPLQSGAALYRVKVEHNLSDRKRGQENIAGKLVLLLIIQLK